MKIRNILLALILVISAFISCSRKLVLPSAAVKGKAKTYDSAAFEYVFIEALRQKLLANPGEAIKNFEQSLKINPNSDGACYQIAQILLAGGDVNNAKKYLIRANDIDGKNYWYLMMLAGTYYQTGNIDSAILYYEKAVKNFPEKEELKLSLGNLYSEEKKYDKAAAIYEDLNKKYGINESSTAASVRNYIEAKQFNKAQELATELIGKYPDNVLYKGLLAQIYSETGDEKKASEIYGKMMSTNPGDPATQLSLCDFLLKQKRYEELATLLNAVVINSGITNSQKVELFTGLFDNQELTKKYGNNLIFSLMVLEAAAPQDEIIKLLRPELLTKMKRYSDAAERLETIIKENQQNYYAWERLLLVYLDEANYKKLQERGEECATLFNRSFLAKILYATGANQNGDYDTAMKELQKATILAGNNNELLLQVLSVKADVYYRMKDYENAFKTFDEALKMNNSDLTMLNNYAYYLAEQDTRLKDAEKMSREVIKREIGNNTYLDTYGWVLFKRGKIKEAEKIFNDIFKSEAKPDAEYYEHMGYVMKKKKDCGKAIENWNSALKLDSTKTELKNEIEKCKKQ